MLANHDDSEHEDVVLSKEIMALENEFRWVLDHEVHNVLNELRVVLSECVEKFPVGLCGIDKPPSVEKFVLGTPSTTPTDQLKVVVTLCGDSISHADINLKLPAPGGRGKDIYQNTSIREECPWRLQQIQDAANHLQLAVGALGSADASQAFRTTKEVDSFLDRVMQSLHRARTAIVNPKKRTLEELNNSKQVKSLIPALPPDLALSFYLQGWKLVFAVYHITQEKGVPKFSRFQAESVIPWINEVLLLLTVGMQTAQQLRDKVNIFRQYPDLAVEDMDASG